MSAQCNTLFCIAEKHDDETHIDVTGYTWEQPNSDTEEIAHVISLD